MGKSEFGMTLVPSVNSSSVQKCQWENVLPDAHEVDEERSVILDLEGLRRLGEQVARVRERLVGRERPQPGVRGPGGAEVGQDAGAASDLGALCGQGSGSEGGD